MRKKTKSGKKESPRREGNRTKKIERGNYIYKITPTTINTFYSF